MEKFKELHKERTGHDLGNTRRGAFINDFLTNIRPSVADYTPRRQYDLWPNPPAPTPIPSDWGGKWPVMRNIFSFLDRPISWLYTRWIFGARCPENFRGCVVCDQWVVHDDLWGEKTKT